MEMYIDFNALPDDLNQGVVLRQGRVKRAGKSPQQFEDDEVQRLLSIEHVDKLVMQYVVAGVRTTKTLTKHRCAKSSGISEI